MAFNDISAYQEEKRGAASGGVDDPEADPLPLDRTDNVTDEGFFEARRNRHGYGSRRRRRRRKSDCSDVTDEGAVLVDLNLVSSLKKINLENNN
jgi:hypothetical protein